MAPFCIGQAKRLLFSPLHAESSERKSPARAGLKRGHRACSLSVTKRLANEPQSETGLKSPMTVRAEYVAAMRKASVADRPG